MSLINVQVKSVEEDRVLCKKILLLEPIDGSRIEDYHYDIRSLEKDFDVEEIHSDLHFVFSDQVSKFFEIHGDDRYQDLTQLLRFINEAAVDM